MVKSITIKIALIFSLARKWEIRHLDVNNAFLNKVLQEDMFMQQSPSLKQNKQQVCKLRKALYGLKQAPLA